MKKFDEAFYPIFTENLSRVIKLIRMDMFDGEKALQADFLLDYSLSMGTSICTTLVMNLLEEFHFQTEDMKEELFQKMLAHINQKLIDAYAELSSPDEKIH